MNNNSTEIKVSQLKEFVPLSSLSDERLKELSFIASLKEISAGMHIFHEGDVDNQSTYLLKGEVQMISSGFTAFLISCITFSGFIGVESWSILQLQISANSFKRLLHSVSLPFLPKVLIAFIKSTITCLASPTMGNLTLTFFPISAGSRSIWIILQFSAYVFRFPVILSENLAPMAINKSQII